MEVTSTAELAAHRHFVLKPRLVGKERGNPSDKRLGLLGREVLGVRFARRPALGDMDDITVAGGPPDQIHDAVLTRTRTVGRRTEQQVDELVALSGTSRHRRAKSISRLHVDSSLGSTICDPLR